MDQVDFCHISSIRISHIETEQQDKIIKLLLEHGAKQIDQDASGKTAYQAATSEWIRLLLN